MWAPQNLHISFRGDNYQHVCIMYIINTGRPHRGCIVYDKGKRVTFIGVGN